MSGLEKGELKKLLDEPPLLEGSTILEAPTSALTADEEEVTLDDQPFHVKFGKVDVDTKGLVPLAAPEWLDDRSMTQATSGSTARASSSTGVDQARRNGWLAS